MATLSDYGSPYLYNSLVEDEYLSVAADHIGEKISKFISRKSKIGESDPDNCMDVLVHNMSVVRKIPRIFLVFRFSLVNNAVVTELKVSRNNVVSCSYCGSGDDSIEHWLEYYTLY